MHPKISVIVPVYNTERFLRRCVDSILSQTFSDFELLLVDDGSKDQSGAICDEFADRDKRITVIHKPNTGVSDTRNRALDLASGEFVIFMDADDYWLFDTVLEQLYETAVIHRLDIVRGEYTAVDETEQEIFSRSVSRQRMQYANQVVGSYEFLEYAVHGEFFLPLVLIRRNIIGASRFESGRIFLEDMQFLSRLTVRPLRCMYRPDIRFYAYRKNTQSISVRKEPLKLQNSLSMCSFYNELAGIKEVREDTLRRYFQRKSILFYYYTLDTLTADPYYGDYPRYVQELDFESVRRQVLAWMNSYPLRFWSPVYYLSPFIGVRFLALKHLIGKAVHAIRP